MKFRLVNQENPSLTLCLVAPAWYSLIDLAEVFRGDYLPFELLGRPGIPSVPLYGVIYNGQEEMGSPFDDDEARFLIPIEVALMLADALEAAFLSLEPVRRPSSYFMVADSYNPDFYPPAIGVIQEVIRFCQQGSFWLEAID